MKRKLLLAGALCLVVSLVSVTGSLYSQASKIPVAGLKQASGDATIPDAGTHPLEQTLPVDSAVTVGKFSNGLRYFIRENHEPENRAELRLVVNAGSILEDGDQLGLAHFLEHMAFNGTKNFQKQELVAFMESIGMRLGPEINAFTSFDETVYQLELPTDNSEYMAKAFQILKDWSRDITLDSEEIDKERGVVIEEWRLGQGAASRLRDKYFPVLFKGSRYAERLPIGKKENLETFDQDVLRRFYHDWYRPDLMAVIAVGDFDSAQVLELTKKCFENLANPPNPRERKLHEVPDHDETLFSIATDKEVPSTSIEVYYLMEPEEERTVGDYRRKIVEQLYNSMLNNRFDEFARNPDPPFLRASSSSGNLVRTKGVYALSASVLEDGVPQGLKALVREAERVIRFGFTPSELERQKITILRAMERAHTNRDNTPTGAFAAEYTRAFLTGEPIPGIDYEYALYKRFIPEITLEEVNRVGRNWIQNSNRVVLLTGPDKEGLEMPGEGELAAVLDSINDTEIAPYVDTVTDRPLLVHEPEGSKVIHTRALEGDIVEWTLANGIKAVLKVTDFDEDQVLFTGFSPGGTSLASDEDFVPASNASSLISGSGIGEFDMIELRKLMAGKVADANPFISTYEEGVSGGASLKDLETMFQLIYLRFVAPRADDTLYQLWMTRSRQAIENREAIPMTVFNDAFTRIITQNHPRLRPPTIEMLEKSDLKKSLAFYEDRFADAEDFVFVFVGSFDPEQMKPLVERYLGALPATDREETWRDIGVRAPQGVINGRVYKGTEPQSQTRIAFTGPFDYGKQSERSRIRALAMTLETRLRNIVREELGATYSISVSASTSWLPIETYTITISFGSDPERVDEVVRTILDEIEDLKKRGPTAQQVSDTREAMLRSFETSLQQNRSYIGQLAVDYRRGDVPGESLRTFPSSVDKLTPASIRSAARKYFNMENRICLTLMPDMASQPTDDN